MSGRIGPERFRKYALSLLADLKNGLVPVCPCCLHPNLKFTTDDGHGEYWLECAACHMGARSGQFSEVRSVWSRRVSKDPGINTPARDIECGYWNEETDRMIYVTREGLEPGKTEVGAHGTDRDQAG